MMLSRLLLRSLLGLLLALVLFQVLTYIQARDGTAPSGAATSPPRLPLAETPGLPAPVQLQFRPRQGEVRLIRLEIKQSIGVTAQVPSFRTPSRKPIRWSTALVHEAKQQLGIDFSCETLSPSPLAEELSQVRVFIRAIRYRKVGAGASKFYDSTRPTKKLGKEGRIYSALINASLSYKFDALGRVVNLPDKAAFYNRISRGLGGTPKEVADLRPFVELLAGDVAFKYIPATRASFSPQKVSIGDKWTVSTPQMSGDGLSGDWNVIYQGVLKLREQQKGVSTLDATGKLVPFLEVKGLAPAAMTGAQHGTYFVDIATGWTRSLQLEQNGSVHLRPDAEALRVGDKIDNPNREFLVSSFVTQIKMRTLGIRDSSSP